MPMIGVWAVFSTPANSVPNVSSSPASKTCAVTDRRRLRAVRVVLVAGRSLLVYPDQRTYFETVLV